MLQSKQPPIGSKVEVHANGSIYRGTLMGMSETELYIKTDSRTWALPLSHVARVQKIESANPKK